LSTEGNGRLSVSEDKLRAILSDFRLELVKDMEKLATTAALDMLDARVKVLELWQAGIVAGSQTRQGISARALAWAALIVACVSALIYLFR
jgi:hypothetical protein